jgi:hypothetical protein
MSNKPIPVHKSALTELGLSNLRVALMAAGAFAAGRGWLSENEIAQYIPFAMILAPWAWGQYSRLRLWLAARIAALSMASGVVSR